jgi:outer membrane biosynthesis protein TonB
MHLERHDIRPPSMLEAPPWSREMLTGGLVAALGAHFALPLLILLVTTILAATLAKDPPPPVIAKSIVEARFVRLGKKPEPKKLPQRKVPRKATAPDPATVVSKNPNPEKPKPDAGPPPERRTEDLLTRIGDRAQALAEIVDDKEPEGDPEGSAEGTDTEAQVGDVYIGKLVAFFRRGWTIPSTIGDTSKLKVTTTFEITRDLKVGDYAIEQSSGEPLFDQSVEDRFAQLRSEGQTLPAPPPEVADRFIGQTIGVIFRGEGGK